MKPSTHLLIIDPQNDFCDLPSDWCPTDAAQGAQYVPALPVKGAHEDMLRLATFIRELGAELVEVTITLDTHHRYDIAHPAFWLDAQGSPVHPFTEISLRSVQAGEFRPRLPAELDASMSYLRALEEAGRYRLMVWPTHCEMGTWGACVHGAVLQACHQWEVATGGSVDTVLKGMNARTEHYSAIMAEVPDPRDPETQLNKGLIERLRAADQVLIAGEAGSHCVRATTEHIADAFGGDHIPKLVILSDCISAVSGFEQHFQEFLADMKARGARVCTSVEFLASKPARVA